MKTIYNPVYQYEVVVFAGTPYKTAAKFAQKKLGFDPICSDTRIGCCIRHNQVFSHILWFKDKKPHYSTIAHEAIHSVYHIMDQLEAKINFDNEEVFAYLHTWTMDEIIKKLRMKN